MNKIIVGILLFLIPTQAYGETKYLEKGSIAPFTGYLFELKTEQQARRGLLERDYYKGLSESQQKIIDLQNQNNDKFNERLNLYIKQNDNLAVSLSEAKDTSDWTKILWFTLGVGATGLAIYGASKITK